MSNDNSFRHVFIVNVILRVISFLAFRSFWRNLRHVVVDVLFFWGGGKGEDGGGVVEVISCIYFTFALIGLKFTISPFRPLCMGFRTR